MKFAEEQNPAQVAGKDYQSSTLIFHIADPNQWEQAQVSQIYYHPSLHSEGFIHCSGKDQIEDTANHYFADTDQILILFIDTSRLNAEVVYEQATRGGEYPHIYGPLNISSVIRTKQVKRRGKKFRIALPD